MSKPPKKAKAPPRPPSRLYQVYELVLSFQAPLLTQQSGTLGVGIDSMMQRYQGKPVLNGSLVKGNLRHALSQLALLLPPPKKGDLAKNIERWLGHKPLQGEESERQWQGDLARGQVCFDTFWCYQGKTPVEQAPLRNRIKINAQGTVEEGALMSLEDCFPLDSVPRFVGKLRASFKDQVEQQAFERSLEKALQLIPALGSLKGIGFGRLLTASLVPQQEQALLGTLAKTTTRFGLRMRFEQPFCVGRPRTNDSNRIESDNFISGAIIKGTLAQQYARGFAEPDLSLADLSRRLRNKYQFDAIIISHALPCVPAAEQWWRSLPVPLSLVSNGEVLFDASAYTLDALIRVLGEAPASFQPDWKGKEWAAAATLCQQAPEPQRLTLVRTEINPVRNSAEESRLFSMECIDPSDSEWLSVIDLSQTDAAKRPALLRDLTQLFAQGLTGVGKTKAQATLEFVPAEAMVPACGSLPETFSQAFEVKLMLVTEARLLPQQLERLFERYPPNQQSDGFLQGLYQDYWRSQSEQGLSLVRYFAQQQRYGGEYARRHYQQQSAQPPQPYAPEWITQAGSVFLLRVENQQGLDCLKRWQQLGLPAVSEADGSAATWKSTAFVPENGYGEICINWPLLDKHHSPATGYPLVQPATEARL